MVVCHYLDIVTISGAREFLSPFQLEILDRLMSRFVRELSQNVAGLQATHQPIPKARRNILLLMLRMCVKVFGYEHAGYRAALNIVPWFVQWLTINNPPDFP
jgi:hypothetical protein